MDDIETLIEHRSPVALPTPGIGLGSLVTAASGWHSFASGDMRDAEVLLVFAFGEGGDGSISLSNERLAAAANRWPELGVLAQTEVATALARSGRLAVDVEVEARNLRGLGPQDYVDTAMVAKAASRFIRGAGWRRVGVLAHPAHIVRCAATCRRLGLEPIVPDLSDAGIVFDRASEQWWTRRRSAWIPRELAVIAHQTLTRNLQLG